MLVVHDAFESSDLPHGGIGTIGKYDGVHRGQRAILSTVVERAEATGTTPMVVTFEPHPSVVLRGEDPGRLTGPEQKERLLEEAGIEVLLVVRFTERFADTPAETFVREFLHRKLGLEEIYVGESFGFGRGREGNLEMLRRLGGELGFSAQGCDEVLYRGERISSTRIRRALSEGRAGDVLEMLGRPYSVVGKIVKGDRMGKRLGWPTINVAAEDQLLPGNGVYAGRVRFPAWGSLPFEAVTNVGTRPTVYENHQRVVESHILDFSNDVYGERVEVELWKRLRGEKIFPTVMDLSAQIGRDVEATREFFLARKSLEQGMSAVQNG